MKQKFVLVVLVFFLLSGFAVAQQSTIMALQGKLVNQTTGAQISLANIRINVSNMLGETIWNQTYVDGVTAGFFDLLLGADSTNPMNLTFNEDYNISIYIGESATQIGGTYQFRGGQGMITPSNISSGNFSGGDYTFGGTLHIDETNNRVGIGTTSPTTVFTLNSSDKEFTRFITSSASQNNYLTIETVGAASSVGLQIGRAGSGLMSGIRGGGELRFLVNGNYGSVLDGTPNMIILSSGNVGIGITSPTKLLEISDATDSLTFDPAALVPTINTTSPGGDAKNITVTSEDGSVIIQLG